MEPEKTLPPPRPDSAPEVSQLVPTEHDHLKWFQDHYEDAPSQVIEFLSADGLSLEGATVADIGCGDGIIDLGVIHKAKPAKLVGFDVRETDVTALRRMSEVYEVDKPFPDDDQLTFLKSGATELPAPNNTFDFAFTWSVFEHVDRPVEMFREIRRILKPDGKLFLQIWPLYYSEHGGHLWLTYRESFSHLLRSDEEIERTTHLEPATDPTRPGDDEYRSLNRLTIDDLQRALLAGGLLITKLQLQSETIHIPEEVALRPLSGLGISGVKLIAVSRFK